MMIALLSCVTLITSASIPVAENADIVATLPGYGAPPSPIYSGFLDASATKKVGKYQVSAVNPSRQNRPLHRSATDYLASSADLCPPPPPPPPPACPRCPFMQLHYVLVQAEVSPSTAPVVLWLNGGKQRARIGRCLQRCLLSTWRRARKRCFCRPPACAGQHLA